MVEGFHLWWTGISSMGDLRPCYQDDGKTGLFDADPTDWFDQVVLVCSFVVMRELFLLDNPQRLCVFDYHKRKKRSRGRASERSLKKLW
jgi:hypothetical protein